MFGQTVRALAQALVFIALPTFLGAGTLAWTAGWVFVATFLVASLVWCVLLYRSDPGLLQERLKGIYQPGQPGWDKAFLTAVSVAWFALLVLIGADAKRFHWSHMPFSSRSSALRCCWRVSPRHTPSCAPTASRRRSCAFRPSAAST
jgi:hypothetical protein